MSLADELLADLEENDQEDADALMELEEKPKVYEEKPNIDMLIDTAQITSVGQLCKLRDSEQLQGIIKEIKLFKIRERKSSEIIGPVEGDPEYQLIVEANNIAADIDGEIGK